jgi:hypothetical protein
MGEPEVSVLRIHLSATPLFFFTQLLLQPDQQVAHFRLHRRPFFSGPKEVDLPQCTSHSLRELRRQYQQLHNYHGRT